MDLFRVMAVTGLIVGVSLIAAWSIRAVAQRPRPHRMVSLNELLKFNTGPAPRPAPTPKWSGAAPRLWAGQSYSQFASDPRDLLDR